MYMRGVVSIERGRVLYYYIIEWEIIMLFVIYYTMYIETSYAIESRK